MLHNWKGANKELVSNYFHDSLQRMALVVLFFYLVEYRTRYPLQY